MSETLVKYFPAHTTEIWTIQGPRIGKTWNVISEEDGVYLAADVDALVRDFHRVLTQTYIDLRDVNCELGRDAAKQRLDLELRLLKNVMVEP